MVVVEWPRGGGLGCSEFAGAGGGGEASVVEVMVAMRDGGVATHH